MVRHWRRIEEPPPPARCLRVGLLGGSFNPAHDGHLYISEQSMKRLGLDQVWWLVSPQNPLKPSTDMAPFEERLARARALACDPRIRVSDLEARLGTVYTVDTLRRLRALFPHRFVWLIGADNLVQLPEWRRWPEILRIAPVAIFDRDDYCYSALAGKAARRFVRSRVRPEDACAIADLDPPVWTYVRPRRHLASGAEIRRRRAGHAMGEREEVTP